MLVGENACKNAVKPPYLVIDGRRMIPDFAELVARGYSYLAVGEHQPEAPQAEQSRV